MLVILYLCVNNLHSHARFLALIKHVSGSAQV